MPATQQHRFVAIGTALAKDKLLLESFSFTEQIGRLFQLEVELASEDPAVDVNEIVGTNATVRLQRPDGKTRYFNGYISRFAQSEQHLKSLTTSPEYNLQ